MTKIDRKSKPIKKQEKFIKENLKRKRIFLEQDNFDILQVLQKLENKAPLNGRLGSGLVGNTTCGSS